MEVDRLDDSAQQHGHLIAWPARLRNPGWRRVHDGSNKLSSNCAVQSKMILIFTRHPVSTPLSQQSLNFRTNLIPFKSSTPKVASAFSTAEINIVRIQTFVKFIL